MRRITIIFLLVMPLFLSAQKLDIQGHRGARGLLPENSIPAFLRAIDEGVTTLELDVVITADKQVVVSHEAYMSASICLKPNGDKIKKADEKKHNIFEMNYAEVMAYDCGSLENPRFEDQKAVKTNKPLLSDVIKVAEKYVLDNKLAPVNYNVEIKSSPAGENIFHPDIATFSSLVLAVLNNQLPKSRYTIQSFDFRVLQHLNAQQSGLTLVALVENAKQYKTLIEDLGFTPQVFSPNHFFLTKEIIDFCHKKDIKVIPWTVNDRKRMEKLVEIGVDGLITDFPNRAKHLR